MSQNAAEVKRRSVDFEQLLIKASTSKHVKKEIHAKNGAETKLKIDTDLSKASSK